MARTETPVVRSQFLAAIKVVEQSGPLESRDALYNAIAKIYNKGPVAVQINKNVAMLRIKMWGPQIIDGYQIKTQNGKRGRKPSPITPSATRASSSIVAVSPAPTAIKKACSSTLSLQEIGEIINNGKKKVGMESTVINFCWNTRLRTTMGYAVTKIKQNRGDIHFNPILFARATREECVDTVLHELAHVLTQIKHRVSCGHNSLWRQMAIVLGGKPVRCHKVNADGLRNQRQPKITVNCKNCPWKISRTIRGMANLQIKQKRGVRYSCPKCKTPIVF